MRCIWASSFVLLLLDGRAGAQPVDPRQIAVAQALVDEGRKLLAAGKPEEACPRFEEAVRAAPAWGIGALAQLADCYEKAGRLASAWATWVQVESAARVAGQTARVQAAHERVTALQPKVPRLTIVAPESLREQAGVSIARDGETIPREQWGLPLPVDPGRHKVHVTAPNKAAWEAEIDVRSGDVQVLAPDHLGESPAPPSPARSPEVTPSKPAAPAVPDIDRGKVQRRVGIAVGAAGLAALEVASIFLAVNLTKAADDNAVCSAAPAPSGCGTEAGPGRLRAAAITARTGAIVSGVLGVAALGSGIAIYETAPPAGHGATMSAVLGPGIVAVRGQW